MKKTLLIITSICCASLLSITIQAQKSPPVSNFYSNTDGEFQQEGKSYKVTIVSENQSTSEGIRLTNSAGQSVYYARSIANQLNKYVCDVRQHQSIEYLSNDRIKYVDTKKGSVSYFTRVRKVSFVTDGTFKQENVELVFTVKSNPLRSVNNIKAIDVLHNNTVADTYMRSTTDLNKYTSSAIKRYIEYISDDRFKLVTANNTSSYFDRVAETETEMPRIPPASYNFKVDGNHDGIEKVTSKDPLEVNELRFTLSTNSQITWWKGIKVFDKHGRMICLLSTQDSDHGPKLSKTFDAAQFGSTVKVEFWKAKTAGVYTKVGTKYFKLSELQGWQTNFGWVND